MEIVKLKGKDYVVSDFFCWEALYANGKLATANIDLDGDYSAYFNFNLSDESGTLVLDYCDIDYGHEMNFTCTTLQDADKILNAFLDANEIELDPKYKR